MAKKRPATRIKPKVEMPVVVIPTNGEPFSGRIASFTEHGAFIETDKRLCAGAKPGCMSSG